MVDDYSPIYVGDTGKPFAPQFLYGDDTPVDLSNATLSMIMYDGEVVKTCTNVTPNNWIVDDAVNGKAHRTWHANDVNTDGDWELFITVSLSGSPVHADVKKLLILPVPSSS